MVQHTKLDTLAPVCFLLFFSLRDTYTLVHSRSRVVCAMCHLSDQSKTNSICLILYVFTVDYPYINYGIASRQQTNGEDWQQTARLASLERFDPQNLRYFSDHLVDVYEEAATIARPPLQPHCRRPLSNKTGYIVCVYKVFEGDDGEKFERNWLYWTGTVQFNFFFPVSYVIHPSV